MPDSEEEAIQRITALFEQCRLLHREAYPSTSIDFDRLDLTGHVTYGQRAHAKGHYSDVYKGRIDDGTVAAIKCLRLPTYNRYNDKIYKDTVLRFFREVNCWGQLNHINVVPMCGYCLLDGTISLVSRWHPNGNLVEYLHEHPNASKQDLALDVAEGIHYLHSRPSPLIHGDLKGANVLINEHSIACIADFGLSKQMDDLNRQTGFSTTSGATGTLPFTAPELGEGAQFGLPCDIYSCAGVFLQIYCPGKVPYDHIGSRFQIIQTKSRGETPQRSFYPEMDGQDALWQVMSDCWAREPERRPKISTIVQEMYKEFQLAARQTNTSPFRPRLDTDPSQFTFDLAVTSQYLALGRHSTSHPAVGRPLRIPAHGMQSTLAEEVQPSGNAFIYSSNGQERISTNDNSRLNGVLIKNIRGISSDGLGYSDDARLAAQRKGGRGDETEPPRREERLHPQGKETAEAKNYSTSDSGKWLAKPSGSWSTLGVGAARTQPKLAQNGISRPRGHPAPPALINDSESLGTASDHLHRNEPTSARPSTQMEDITPNDDISDISISSTTSPGLPALSSAGQRLRSPSPAPSVISYRSSDRRQLVRETYGRELNTFNELWRLPADSEEYSRHNIQHRVLAGALGSLYAVPDSVRQALAPSQDPTPAILDIGTGSGCWAIEIATEFSHADVVGIDLAPPILEGPIPSNLRFEIDDVNLSLEHYSGCFNVVHSRSVESGINDFQRYLYDLAQILRPNGVLLLATGLMQLYDEHLQPLANVEEGSPGFSPIQNMFTAASNCIRLLGGTTAPWFRKSYCTYLETNENYKQVGAMSVDIPVGAWQSGLNEKSYRVAELNRLNTFGVLHALRPLVLKGGLLESVVDRWLELAALDLRSGKARIFARWEWAWAVRTAAEWKAQPRELV